MHLKNKRGLRFWRLVFQKGLPINDLKDGLHLPCADLHLCVLLISSCRERKAADTLCSTVSPLSSLCFWKRNFQSFTAVNILKSLEDKLSL